MAKVVITEAQYNRLEKILLETKYDVVLKKTVKVGDVIRLTYKNTTSNFKVVQNQGGQILMDNIDMGSTNKNYRYFITISSLHDNVLEIRRAHKTKEKDKLKDIKSWKKLDVNGVTDIDVIRNGKVIDSVDTPIPTEKKIQPKKGKTSKEPISDEFKQSVDELILKIVNVKTGQGLVFDMADGTKINFCVDASQSFKYTLGLRDKSPYEALNDWDSFGYSINYNGDDPNEDIYEANKDLITTSDGKNFNFKITGFSGEKTKNLSINGIKNIDVINKCEGEEDVDNTKGSEEKAKLKNDAKRAYEIIINDPLLKQAFYKQPSLWNLFVAELKGKKAVGSGIVPTLDLVGKYKTKKIEERLGSEFKSNKIVTFNVLDKPVQIVYLDKNATSKKFQLDVGKPYEIKVRDYKIGDEFKVLYSGVDSYKILVKEKTDEPNIFLCEVVKMVRLPNEIKQYSKKDVRIKFLPSEGYKPKTR